MCCTGRVRGAHRDRLCPTKLWQLEGKAHLRRDSSRGWQPKKLRFTKPWSFNSPSAAAAVVLDRNSNGRLEWKVKGSKQTYHDWQQAEASAST
ncbi:DUF4357 domain-containing protein [Roseovarius phycicola]|uniref:DUF4357 domain-containing protein n=1 Tax=Roseovarius phycicola TaxID=3080976 RepID=UPI003BB0502C